MPTDTHTTPPAHALTVTLVARCDHCQWSAQLTADTLEECAGFLQARLIAHSRETHPGASATGAYLCDARKEARE
jgi:hypothetical protein